jgi:hypothetical protein
VKPRPLCSALHYSGQCKTDLHSHPGKEFTTEEVIYYLMTLRTFNSTVGIHFTFKSEILFLDRSAILVAVNIKIS